MIYGPFILFISLVLSLSHPKPQKWVYGSQSQGDNGLGISQHALGLCPLTPLSGSWLTSSNPLSRTSESDPKSRQASHAWSPFLGYDLFKKSTFQIPKHVRGAGFSLQHEFFHAECHTQGPLTSFKARELGRRPVNRFPLLHRLQFPFCL